MRIKVLGSIEVEHDGAPLALGGPQQRRLMALLVVNRGTRVSSDRLVDALWPDGCAPEGAPRSLRTYLSRLRAVLPPDTIQTRAGGYSLRTDGIDVDADEFDALLDEAERSVPDVAIERYERARRLWRDQPFGEFGAEWWARAESSRLIERRIAAEEQHAAALMAIGHLNRAVPELERLVAEEPLREAPVLLLMQALNATGRRAEALRAGVAFRSRLAEQTGLEPSTEVGRLEAAMLADDGRSGGAVDRPLRGYVLGRAIGEGAHGRVYEATQPGTDRVVAIKVVRPELADSSDFIRRFEDEARLVARLEHPHIVPLYDYWREPGGAYLVFRLLAGGSLRDSLITGGPWSVERVSNLVEQVGGALVHAHAAGVAHRDVRTSNVLLDAEGVAYLTDFGVAVTGDDSLAESGMRGDVQDLAWLLCEVLIGPQLVHPGRGGASSTMATVAAPRPDLMERTARLPDGLSRMLVDAAGGVGDIRSMAELVLAWRATTGVNAGPRTPLTEGERGPSRSRDSAVRRLTLAAMAGHNPYRGLRAFDTADRAVFHGRQSITEHIVALVESRRVVAVIGASGSGKSSLVRAGIVPHLHDVGTVTASMVPGDDPLTSLREAVTSIAPSRPAGTDVVAGALADVASRFGRVVLVVDQFEECWTRVGEAERNRFLDVVGSLLDPELGDIRLVVAIRADMLDRPLQHPLLGPAIGAGAVVVPPLDAAGLAEAITEPAAQFGVRFDDGVVAELTSDAASRPGALPLLQFTLTELFERRVDGFVGRDALAAVGGMAGAIGRRAEEVYGSLAEHRRSDARALFARLVVPSRDGPDTRRRARIGELAPGSRSVADSFVAARLLVVDRDPATREPTVELAHEALIERWARLAGWIDEDRRWMEQLHHLADAARTWDVAGRSDEDVHRGARLELAIEAIEQGRSISEMERSFIDAGCRVRDADALAARSTAARLRRLLAAVAAALVLALVGGGVAFVQRREAVASQRDAQIEGLIGRIESLRSTQRDTAALLAVEAFRIADTPRTRSALLASFTAGPPFLDARRLDGDRGTSGIVMPDGTAFVTAQNGRIVPYDLDTGGLGAPLPAIGDGDTLPVLAGSPDGALLAVAARIDPTVGPTIVGVIDTRTSTLALEPFEVGGAVTSIVFLPDDRLALATGEAGDVVVVDLADGARVASIPGVDIEPDEIVWALDSAGAGRAEALRRPSAVALAADGLLVGAADGTLRIFDPHTLEQRDAFSLTPETLASLRPVGDGTAVTSGRIGVVRVDLSTGAVTWQIDGLGTCLNLTVMPERGTLYCSDAYGRLDERDLESGAVTRPLDPQEGNSGALWPSRDGTELVSFGDSAPVVSRWRVDGSGPISEVVAPGWTPIDFDPAGGSLLLVERGDVYENTYESAIVDLADGGSPQVVPGLLVPSWSGERELLGISVGPDGPEWVGVTVDDAGEPGDLRFSDVAVDRVDILDLRIDPGKHRMLLRYGDDSLATLDTATLRHGATIQVDGLVSWQVNRSGDRIVAGTTDGVLVFDADSGDEVGRIDDPNLRAVVVTPADQLIVGSVSGDVAHYDLATLAPIGRFGGSRGHVLGGSGTADGSVVALHGGDRLVALYDVESGVQLGGGIGIAPTERNAARLSLDGRRLIVGGRPTADDGPVPAGAEPPSAQLWHLDPDRWIEAACRVAGRNLTSEEWAEHIGTLRSYRPTCPELPAP